MTRTPIVFATVLLAGSLFHVADAGAADVVRYHGSHGVANCQSALPVFDGLIRKRPKAVANQGTANAFVTCDFENLTGEYDRVTVVGMVFINRGGAASPVNCTLVQGVGDVDFAPAITKTVLAAPGERVQIVWEPADNDGDNFSWPALSCNLRPGVEISATVVNVLENIGS